MVIYRPSFFVLYEPVNKTLSFPFPFLAAACPHFPCQQYRKMKALLVVFGVLYVQSKQKELLISITVAFAPDRTPTFPFSPNVDDVLSSCDVCMLFNNCGLVFVCLRHRPFLSFFHVKSNNGRGAGQLPPGFLALALFEQRRRRKQNNHKTDRKWEGRAFIRRQ